MLVRNKVSLGILSLTLFMFLLALAANPTPYSFTPFVIATNPVRTDISVHVANDMINNNTGYPDLLILDVRGQGEYDINHLHDALLIPLSGLASRLDEIESYNETEIIVYCRLGVRSLQGSDLLVANNFTKVFNMLGGITAWIEAGYDYWSNEEEPIIDNPADIQYDEGATGYSITWDPSDLNPQNYTIYRDGLIVQSGLWNASIETITISVDGLSLGSYTYLIVVGDVGLNTASDTVLVTVVDGTNPTIDSPIDPNVVEGSSGNQITWNPYDLHPASYEIYREEILVKSGLWNSSSEPISFSVDGLSLGVYNITIVVYDTTSRTAIDTVFVTVYDGTAPIVDNPADIDGDSGYSITWSPSDLHPVSYQILREGVQVKSGTWNTSGETMTISVDGLSIGSYNYTIVLTDIGGNTVTDEVIVTVYSADVPTIDQPANQTISEGATGLFVTWNPLDLNPSSYAIYQNGVIVKSGQWNSSAETISISLDGLSLGTYNFTALVTDLDSNTAKDTVWVTVIDGTPPTVDSPIDITYDEGSPGGTITWSPTDLHPVSYTIYLEGSPVKSGLWNSSGEFISISVDGLLVGVYNYTISVLDVGGNIDTDNVFVYVLDGTSPTIDTPGDINYNEGDAGGSITWDPSDTYPTSYEIFRNEILVKSGLWNSSSETISISVTGLSVGQYNFTIIVYDVGGNTVSDIVWVTVSDATPPEWLDLVTDQHLEYGEGLEYQLSAFDVSGIDHWSLNDTINFHMSTSGLITNKTALDSGQYGLLITALDPYGNELSAQLTVFVGEEITTPTTSRFDDINPILVYIAGAALAGASIVIIVVVFFKKR